MTVSAPGFSVRGRLVVVTGGASGIGAALAKESSARGARAVAVIDLDPARASAAADALDVEARGFAADVSVPDDVERVAHEVCDAFGMPGLVCANAGITPPGGPIWDVDPSDAAWTLGVSVIGAWATIRSFGRRMVAAGEPGWLLATGSEHSVGVPHLGTGLYTASKHAVLGMMDVLRHELPAPIGASLIIPGLADTELWRAGASRPQRFGGPLAPPSSRPALMARGMPAAVVAERALDGVEAGRFLIATHRHVREYAERRAADLAEAFDSLASIASSDPAYDLATVTAEIKAQRTNQRAQEGHR